MHDKIFSNLPISISPEKLVILIERLRTKGNCLICTVCTEHNLQLCKNCGSKVCGLRGQSLVNFIIRQHIKLAISIASKFTTHSRCRDKKLEIISVALLSLTKAVHAAHTTLYNDNLSAYLTSNISFGIRAFLSRQPIIRVPHDKYVVDKKPIKVGILSTNVGRRYEFELRLEIKDVLSKCIASNAENIIATCMLKGGYKYKEVAEMCGISISRVKQLRTKVCDKFIELWEQ